MIFRREFLEKIKSKEVTVAYRRWEKLAIKVGGTLRTPVGVLKFTGIKVVKLKNLADRHAEEAGYDSLDDLLRDLNSRQGDGTIYRIEFKLVGPDPRVQLRDKKMSQAEFEKVLAQLKQIDEYSHDGAWTMQLLKTLSKNPGVASWKLAPLLGIEEKLKFKNKVRRLKELGLTISLGTGYKLSSRGESFLQRAASHQDS